MAATPGDRGGSDGRDGLFRAIVFVQESPPGLFELLGDQGLGDVGEGVVEVFLLGALDPVTERETPDVAVRDHGRAGAIGVRVDDEGGVVDVDAERGQVAVEAFGAAHQFIALGRE